MRASDGHDMSLLRKVLTISTVYLESSQRQQVIVVVFRRHQRIISFKFGRDEFA